MADVEFEDHLVELLEWRKNHFFGKYRGVVVEVLEGDDLGLITAKVPEIFGSEQVIEAIRPCSPFAGDKHGFVAIPEPEDGVWIEFEAGNPSLPIWTGFRWAEGQMPEPKGKLVRSFITTKGHKLLLDDDANKVTLLHADGAEMTMTDSDITIKIGDTSIKLTKDDLTLQVGASSTAPSIKITSSDISVAASTSSTVKLTSGGVDICNGAVKAGP
ncbi:MAG TPA: phage baseplate assembly protein V [Pyrinomonadaceae bacterium]|jgi:hypothetical protein|nr:phage baseplate assembly protein V [Pyrinomonadaceae bacterium]